MTPLITFEITANFFAIANRNNLPVLSRQFSLFLLMGGINTALTYALYLLLLNKLDYKIAYAIAFAAGVLISIVLQSRYVFAAKLNWKKIMVYPFIYLIQFAFGLIVITFSVRQLHIGKPYALAVATVLSVPLTFLLNKLVLTHESLSERDKSND